MPLARCNSRRCAMLYCLAESPVLRRNITRCAAPVPIYLVKAPGSSIVQVIKVSQSLSLMAVRCSSTSELVNTLKAF